MEIIFSIIILIFSVIIHEVAHGYSADIQGDPTARLAGRLTLNPIPHIDIVGSILLPALLVLSKTGFIVGWAKPVPFNPYNLKNQRYGSAIVAVAGIGANFFIALIFGLIIRFSGELGITSNAFLSLAQVVVLINLLLGVFNLVPIPPLDGSKILFTFLPPHLLWIEEAMERYALFLILILIFFLWGVISPIVGFLFSLFTGMSL